MADILIIDDSPVFRTTIRNTLELAKHNVVGEAGNADEAYKFLETNKPNLVLLDLLMPGKSGLDALKKIKQNFPDLDILILTAVNQQIITERARNLGASGILFKPFDSDELLEIISKVLKK
jgi:two-component system chemotaxis response regulator CheY